MKKRDLSFYRALAQERGGRCVAGEYISAHVKLVWECGLGHRWSATPDSIRVGSWCRECSYAARGRAKKDQCFEIARSVAARHRGECLSPEYVDQDTRLRWRCARGHEWLAIPRKVASGQWCPYCAGTRLDPLERLQGTASRRLGELLSPEYLGPQIPLQWRCGAGHEFELRPAAVLYQAVWCPQCTGRQWTLDELRALAAERGGECLAQEMGALADKYAWRCRLGHRFDATAANVSKGRWCPRCGRPGRGNLQQMKRLARRRGGQCLSTEYVDWQRPLRWRCREGHEWEAPPNRISNGRWCWVCGQAARAAAYPDHRLDIDDMRASAAERGGLCLSERYVTHERLLWQCARGHRWEAMAGAIRGGHWCPQCSHRHAASLDGMRALAAELGGRCLASEYLGHRGVHRWECSAGHGFELAWLAVKSGAWCPSCRKAAEAEGTRKRRR